MGVTVGRVEFYDELERAQKVFKDDARAQAIMTAGLMLQAQIEESARKICEAIGTKVGEL